MAKSNISVKEIFERLVTMETRLDHMQSTNGKTVRAFTWYALIVIFLSVVNVLVHVLVR